jgi:hypothetical protein
MIELRDCEAERYVCQCCVRDQVIADAETTDNEWLPDLGSNQGPAD